MNKTVSPARKSRAFVLWQLLAPSVLVLALASCSSSKPYDETESWSPARIYEEAKDEMVNANYERAINLYEKLESRYPYGRYAQQAQIDTAYAYYRSGDSVQALAATDRFIKLYPNHRSLDYIYYLRGLINFNENRGFTALVSGENLSERDPKGTRAAFEAFKEVVNRFPKSRYAEDAKERLQYLVNSLAQNELFVARYYYRRGAYLSALNRAQEVIRRFEQTPSVEEALFLSYRCYQQLGMSDLEKDTKRVIDKNFPDSPYWSIEVPEKKELDKKWWQVWKKKGE